MKGRRKSTRKKQKSEENTNQQERAEEEHGGASMSDVPGPILMDIFSRLSVKSIFRCRCVCKPWLDLLFDPVFAKLHFSRAPTCPLLRDSDERHLSRALYLIELERDDSFIICDVPDKSCTTNMNMKLSTIFMLPERESSSRTKIRERRFDIVNSCNGLLCLRKHKDTHPVVIYNPVTGEYSVLPKAEYDKELSLIYCGLGFCSKTKRYKVVIVVFDYGSFRYGSVSGLMTFLYTLGGLGGWRRIGYAPFFDCRKLHHGPVFINGAIHWLARDEQMQKFIISFDFVGEEFRTIPMPPAPAFSNKDMLISKMRIGVLRGHLYICDSSSDNFMDLWVMKDYGFKDSWIKEYDIHNRDIERWPLGLYQPTDFLNDGNLLMYHGKNSLLCIVDEHKSCRYFKIGGTRSELESIAHIPSFVSIKDIMGDTMAVLNVRSSLANSGPRKRTRERLFLVEEVRQLMLGSDSSV